MTALLLYGYRQGIYWSRRLARACQERVDFMAVTALQQPDFRTISDFRQRHLEALGELFVQVLRLCQGAGLVRLGHVALDGAKRSRGVRLRMPARLAGQAPSPEYSVRHEGVKNRWMKDPPK